MSENNQVSTSKDVSAVLTVIGLWMLSILHLFVFITKYNAEDKELIKLLEPFSYKITVSIIVIVMAIWLIYFFMKVSEEQFLKFIDLPKKDTTLTFSIFSTFFGEQAFSSLIATILITFSKTVYEIGGDWLSGVYIAAIGISMIVFSTISLVRFLFVFTSRGPKFYFISALLSTVFMFLLIYCGFKFGLS
ncbi:hypothetical protein AB4508_21990 [Vibrio splendidus]|uniref:hypothetical protein n=1 Tax=Vibrio splendidus TaxID=29497 RepID=UPI00352EA5AA